MRKNKIYQRTGPFKGKKHTETTKKKMSSSHLGHKHTEETRKQISIKMIKLNKDSGYKENKRLSRLGKKLPEKVRIKISQSRKGIKFSEAHVKKLSESHMGKPGWNKGLTSEIDNRIASGERNGMFGRVGKKATNWKGGIGRLPYSLEFNKKLKFLIRKKYDFTCQMPRCGIKENGKSHICHHIDYDKKNNNLENLTLLCRSCNSKVNFNREYWINIFKFTGDLKCLL